MTARSASDLIIARQIAHGYDDMSRSLRRDAFIDRMAQRTLTARITEWYASFVRRAARAEEIDDEPPNVSCGVCHGQRVCDIPAHLARARA